MILGRKVRQNLFTRNKPHRKGREIVAANENHAVNTSGNENRAGLTGGTRRWLVMTGDALWRGIEWVLSAVSEELNHRRPFLFAPVILSAGSALWFAAPEEPNGRAILAVFLLALLLAVWLRHRHPHLARLALAVLLGGAGAMLASVQTGRSQAPMLTRPATVWITTRVTAREPAGEGKWRYRLAILSDDVPITGHGRPIIHVTGRSPPASIGDMLRGRARLQPPAGPAAPGLYDPSFAAHFSGLAGTGYFLGRPAVTAGPPPPDIETPVDRLALALSRWRAEIGDHIRLTIGGDEGALAAALVTNEQRSISRKAIESLRQSGLAHIIAISGMNMVLAAAVFFVGLSSLLSLSVRVSQSLPTRKIAAAGAVLGTAAYYLLSGFALSAERAFLMMLVSLVAVLAGRPAISLRSAALSALAILIVDPSAALSASFQLSFSGTLGLIAAYEAWARRAVRPSRRGQRGALRVAGALATLLAGMLATAVIGGLSTALFSIAHFQRFASAGFVANMLAAPLIDLMIMPMALGALLAMPLGLDWPFLKLMGLGLTAILRIADIVASLGGEITLRPLPTSSFLLAGFGLLLLLLLKTRLRLCGLPVIAMGLLIAWHMPPPPTPDLLIHESGDRAGLIIGQDLLLAAQSSSDPVTDQWQRMLGLPTIVPPRAVTLPPDARHDRQADRYRPLTDAEEIAERALMTESLDEPTARAFQCKRNAWCLARKGNTRIAVVFNGIYTGMACDTADIVISRTGPGFETCHSGALLLSHRTLLRTGSLAASLTTDPRRPVLSLSYPVLARPWQTWRRQQLSAAGSSKDSLPPPLRSLLADDEPAPDGKEAAGPSVALAVSDSGE